MKLVNVVNLLNLVNVANLVNLPGPAGSAAPDNTYMQIADAIWLIVRRISTTGTCRGVLGRSLFGEGRGVYWGKFTLSADV